MSARESFAGESAAPEAASAGRVRSGGKLINIDNGGTLTDLCVIDGERVYRTKTLTTPYDLSKCLIEGLRKVSSLIYGREDLQALLLSTDYIRYSTTQGTNALVERKGPRLGLILTGPLSHESLEAADHDGLLEALIGDRYLHLADPHDEVALTRAVTGLASAGANRLVIAAGGEGRHAAEMAMKRVLLRKFPQHLLGAIPILYSHELVADPDDGRRCWTALLNAFLHPAMERFLYSAEHKLREIHTRNPLLIFRNDGFSARVAKTIAIKTYSSGPRGGAEGAAALARHYGFERLVSMDVGGTTTDLLTVVDGAVRTVAFGRVEGVPTSFPLSDVESVGVGGSSILRVVDGRIQVGPDSVGGVPGPACFGLGGGEATITDVLLIQGLLDAGTFFGGELRLDTERAVRAVRGRLAEPLAQSMEVTCDLAVDAWVDKIARAVSAQSGADDAAVLLAFGGGGPLLACRIAERAGLRRVLIPGLAPVFSAFGIGFSDVAHEHEQALTSEDEAGFNAARDQLLARAERGMFAEGTSLSACRLECTLRIAGLADQRLGADAAWPGHLPSGCRITLGLRAIKPITRAPLQGRFGQSAQRVTATATRNVRGEALPLFTVDTLPPEAAGQGPCVLEDPFFTALIPRCWSFERNTVGDCLLTRTEDASS